MWWMSRPRCRVSTNVHLDEREYQLTVHRQDCSTIANARATGCEGGTCQVYSCFDGYVVSPDRQTCVKKGSVVPPTPVTAFNQGVFDAEKLD